MSPRRARRSFALPSFAGLMTALVSASLSATAFADQCLFLDPWTKERATDIINQGQTQGARWILELCEPCGQSRGRVTAVEELGYRRDSETGLLVLTSNLADLDIAYAYRPNRALGRWENVGFLAGCSPSGVSRYLPMP